MKIFTFKFGNLKVLNIKNSRIRDSSDTHLAIKYEQ